MDFSVIEEERPPMDLSALDSERPPMDFSAVDAEATQEEDAAIAPALEAEAERLQSQLGKEQGPSGLLPFFNKEAVAGLIGGPVSYTHLTLPTILLV